MKLTTMKFINWPLQIKVMCLTTLFQVLLSALLLTGVTQRIDHSFRAQVRTSGQEIENLLGVTLTDPLLHRDYSLLQQVADELVEKKTVTGVRVIDPTGIQIAQSGTTKNLDGLLKSDDPKDLHWANAQDIRYSADVNYGGQLLGRVQYINTLDAHAEERQALLTQFILIALFTTLLAIGAAYLSSGRLVKRIVAIKNVSDAAVNGNYKGRVLVDSNDELGKLALGLNRLADSVSERMKALITSESTKTTYLLSAQTEQARLTSLLDSMRLGIVFLNNQNELVYSNQAVKNIWPNQLPSFIGQATNHGRERTLEDGRIIF